MGSTYLSGYRAGAFQTSSGFAYVSFNQSCESNVFPQNPHWSAHRLDTLSGMGGKIVEHAYCCDSGSTRGPRGRDIRAEHYVEQTEASIRQATLLTGPLNLVFGEYLSDVPGKLLDPFDDLTRRLNVSVVSEVHGARDWVRHIRTVQLGDPTHGDLLLQFSKDHIGIAYPWRMFRHVPPEGMPIAGANWQPAELRPDRIAIEAAAAASFLSKYRLIDLHWQGDGRDYLNKHATVIDAQGQILAVDPLAWFCGGYLKERNSTAFGASRPALLAYRRWVKTVESSHSLESLQIESVLNDSNVSDYILSRAQQLAGGADPTSPFVVEDKQTAWSLLHLVRDGLVIKLPQLGLAQAETAALF